MFSMLWLYAAAFCNSIASIVQKLGTWTDPYMQFFFLGGIKVHSPERAR